MVDYGSIPTIMASDNDKKMPDDGKTPQTLAAPSFQRKHRDARTLVVILATIIVSSLLYAMTRLPLQNVASIREKGSSTLEGIANLPFYGDDNGDKRMNYQVPFPEIDRADYNDPVSGFVQKELFHPSLVSSTSSHHDFTFPFPTGACIPRPIGVYHIQWQCIPMPTSGHRHFSRYPIP